ncbi:DUF5693 family protein [Jeotgalibacillus proteolyticus]|uniref:Uncharacterized protein n=1 Tax=Jeotgalibacillus proteolyticus TaxID=2082395 RepID=A0A2S5GBA3_9BACL|nr:DUF5693 family protein [Jeotgalibacillus proteolyticus]PPA70276.1 hypothetical protein C4B60_11895 [Jeotgalibacillus proteolyticus]
MKNKLIGMGIILLAFILTIPSVYQRVQVEEANKTYEYIIPFQLVESWLKTDPTLSEDDVYAGLSDAGIHSISLEPQTIRSLEQKGLISAVNSIRMREHIILNQLEKLDDPIFTNGLFVHPENGFEFEEVANKLFEEVRPVSINGVEYIFIPGSQEQILSTMIGYDQEAVETLSAQGFNTVLRLTNLTDEVQLNLIVDELISLKADNRNKVLFTGQQLPGYPETEKLKTYANQLSDAGYSLMFIELAKQAGFTEMAYTMDLDVIRLHSLSINSGERSINSERIIRAVKERNIRAIFLNTSIADAGEAIEELSEITSSVQDGLPDFYQAGESSTYKKIEVAKWQIIMALIGSIAFLASAISSIFQRRILTLLTAGSLSILALAYVVLSLPIILKLFALMMAVGVPVYAIMLRHNPQEKWYLVKAYLKAVGTTFIGIWFIIVLLNGNQFILGIDSFRGVKAVYIIPIAFASANAIWWIIRDHLQKLLKIDVKFLNINVKYWHLLIFVVIMSVFYFYLGRTGNSGSVTELELQARVFLEKILYVRPRTKEFLIGFPFFVLALYVAKSNKKLGYFLLIPGVIGFLSMVNTFTHLHIPLSVSLLRSFYSVVLGFLIGLIFIYLYKWLMKNVVIRIKERWQT